MHPETQFACDLSALTNDQRQRQRQVSHHLTELRRSVRELDNGYAFEYADEVASYPLLGEFIAFEHRCCPFFHFNLEVAPEAKSIWLHITGTEGVKEFVYAEFLS
jgi:hypothetical protein